MRAGHVGLQPRVEKEEKGADKPSQPDKKTLFLSSFF